MRRKRRCLVAGSDTRSLPERRPAGNGAPWYHTRVRRLLSGWLVVMAVALGACGGSQTAPTRPDGDGTAPARLRLVGSPDLTATVATSVPVVLEVTAADGTPLAGQVVTFTTAGGGWVPTPQRSTNGAGRTEVQWFLGPDPDEPQSLTASTGSLDTTWVATSRRPEPGVVYAGNDGYIEWLAGDVPIVISAPHGGTLLPTDIPDRTQGTTVRDTDTIELAMAVRDAFVSLTGMRPHVVICHLSRRKLDANREIVEAAAGAPAAVQAWREYHAAIEAAMIESHARAGRAFYVDLHGHGHEAQRLELGYLLSASRLELPDAQLAVDGTRVGASIWPLSVESGEAFPDVLRGPESLGALFDALGFPSVPSPLFPDPGGQPYFDGGYSTARHALNAAGWAAGLQIETNFAGVRDTPASRSAFGQALVSALETYLPRFGWVFLPFEAAGAGPAGRMATNRF